MSETLAFQWQAGTDDISLSPIPGALSTTRVQAVMGWDERNITSKENRTTLKPVSPALHGEPGMSIVQVETYEALAFQYKDDGGASELAPTLRALPHDRSHMNGGGHVAVLISSTEDSPAKTSAWPASGPVLGASVAASGLSSSGSCPNCNHDGSLLRMSLDFYPLTVEQTSESSLPGWTNSGSMRAGRYWTRSTSESRNAAAACSLSAVLEDEVPNKYFLSAKAAAGILRRAKRRGKTLPEPLAIALADLTQS